MPSTTQLRYLARRNQPPNATRVAIGTSQTNARSSEFQEGCSRSDASHPLRDANMRADTFNLRQARRRRSSTTGNHRRRRTSTTRNHRRRRTSTTRNHRRCRTSTTRNHRRRRTSTARNHRRRRTSTTRNHRRRRTSTTRNHRRRRTSTARNHRRRRTSTTRNHRRRRTSTTRNFCRLRNERERRAGKGDGNHKRLTHFILVVLFDVYIEKLIQILEIRTTDCFNPTCFVI